MTKPKSPTNETNDKDQPVDEIAHIMGQCHCESFNPDCWYWRNVKDIGEAKDRDTQLHKRQYKAIQAECNRARIKAERKIKREYGCPGCNKANRTWHKKCWVEATEQLKKEGE